MMQLKQIQDNDIEVFDFSIFIAASGFESRAVLQAQKYAGNSEKKISLGFIGYSDDKVRLKNDSIFKDMGFDMRTIDEDSDENVQLDSIVDSISSCVRKEDKTRIYIDYSCMTRNWYSYLLYRLFNLPERNNIILYFGYSHAQYSGYEEEHQSLNRIVKPLLGYCGIGVPSNPTALVIGMGNEPNRIYGLTDYFDASPYLFYSDKSYNEHYSTEIEDLNKDIIDTTKEDDIFTFPVYDLMYTNHLLDSLCRSLLRKYRVVIAPCGPKPFALLAMINSLKYDNLIEVWRISPGKNLFKRDRKPTGLVSILEISFS
jgi:hypothetical protein